MIEDQIIDGIKAARIAPYFLKLSMDNLVWLNFYLHIY